MSRAGTFRAIWAAIRELGARTEVWTGVITVSAPAGSAEGAKPICKVRVNGVTTGDVPIEISDQILDLIKAGTARGRLVVGLSNSGQYIGVTAFVIGEH